MSLSLSSRSCCSSSRLSSLTRLGRMDPSLHFSPYPIPRIGCLLLSCFAALASADDQALRWLLLVARLDAFLVAPLVHDVAAAARTTTVRVIDRVHDFTTDLGTLSEPAALSSLAV